MLTLTQLYNRTPSLRKHNAQYVRFLKTKKGYNSKGLAFIAVQSHSIRTDDKDGRQIRGPSPNKYVTIVTFLDKKLHALVSCSCSDFCFVHEYALNQKGAADIEYCNGEPPDIRNPRQVPSMCKHACQVYNRIKQHLK